MKDFVFTSEKIDGEVFFRYNTAGLLYHFELRGNWPKEHQMFMLEKMPFTLHELMYDFMPARGKDAKLAEIRQDLSFETFWNAYNHKVGNRTRTAKLWDSMTDDERLNSLASLYRYERFLAFKKQDKAYPETYLHQRRWENEYKFK